jgi:hypothetical protein
MRVTDEKIIFNGTTEAKTNTISFPAILRLCNGTLCVTARIGSGKDTADGNVGIWTSHDSGRTWSGPRIPFKTDFGGKKGCLRAGFISELPGGRLLLTLAWVDRSVEGRLLYNAKTGGLCEMFPVTSESMDGGATWSPLRKVDLQPIVFPAALTGPTLLLADGCLACQFECQKPWDAPGPIFNFSTFKLSHDNGRTWSEHVLMQGKPVENKVYWDQRIAQFSDGRMIALYWTYDTVENRDYSIHMSFSDRTGRSWSKPVDTGLIGQIACPIICDDNHIIMLYVRRDDRREILARASFDGGRIWDPGSEISIYRQGGSVSDSKDLFDAMNQWSYGHPSGIVLDENTIAAVYYAGTGQNTALHFCKIKLD